MGAVTVGIYPTSPAEEVEYLLSHSESVALVTEDEEQFDKATAVRDRLPSLRSIVVMDTHGIDLDAHAHADVLALAALEERDAAHADHLDQQPRPGTAPEPDAAAHSVPTLVTDDRPQGQDRCRPEKPRQ